MQGTILSIFNVAAHLLTTTYEVCAHINPRFIDESTEVHKGKMVQSLCTSELKSSKWGWLGSIGFGGRAWIMVTV